MCQAEVLLQWPFSVFCEENGGWTLVAEASAEFLRRQARHFRQLAREVTDERAREALIQLAEEYESRAGEQCDTCTH